MIMRRHISVLLLLFSLTLSAQDPLDSWFLLNPLKVSTEKKGRDLFKGQKHKGARNGMGFILYKNGDAYAGDFSKNKIHGYGMFLTVNGIKGCEEAVAYVGNWVENKKEGPGICYNRDGDVIYQGRFENDVPIDTYPSTTNSCDPLRHFVAIELH